MNTLLKRIVSPRQLKFLRKINGFYRFTRFSKFCAISEIDLEFVNYCTLRCKWCSLDHHQKKYSMKEDLLRKFFDNLLFDKRFKSVKTLNLFNGGEILLHPDFIGMLKIVKEYKVRFAEKKLRFPVISLLTNGMFLNAVLAKEIVDLNILDSIRFSVDGGSKEKFEELRRNAKWEIVSENIRNFVQINNGRIHTGIICIIELDKPHNTEWMDADFKEVLGLVGNVELRYPHDWMGDVKVEGLTKIIQGNFCHFLFRSLCVLPYGDVVVCCGDLNGTKGVVGNLYKDDLFQCYNSQKRRDIMYKFSTGKRGTIELCKNCSGY